MSEDGLCPCNLVKADILEKEEDFLNNSAIDYLTNQEGLLEIKFLF